MSEETYNGWANRETWACALHMSNDEGLNNEAYFAASVAFREALEETTWTVPMSADVEVSAAINAAADVLCELVTEWCDPSVWVELGVAMPDWAALMCVDVGSLWRVVWRDVVESLLEDDIRKARANAAKEGN